MRDMTTSFLHHTWNMNMLISFIVGREAARCMVPRESDPSTFPCGTVVFVGATAESRRKPSPMAFTQGTAGARLLSQSMAREYGHKGLHVAHLSVMAMVNGHRNVDAETCLPTLEKSPFVGVDSAAETVWQLSVQDPSAWTHELEVRPFGEAW